MRMRLIRTNEVSQSYEWVYNRMGAGLLTWLRRIRDGHMRMGSIARLSRLIRTIEIGSWKVVRIKVGIRKVVRMRAYDWERWCANQRFHAIEVLETNKGLDRTNELPIARMSELIRTNEKLIRLHVKQQQKEQELDGKTEVDAILTGFRYFWL